MNPLIHNGNARMALHYLERGLAGIDEISGEQGMEALEYWIRQGIKQQAIEEAQAADEIRAHE